MILVIWSTEWNRHLISKDQTRLGMQKYSNFLITDINVINDWSNLYKSHRFHKDLMEKTCAYCGKTFLGEGWPHVEGDSNRGVTKIEQFCSEEHKYNFLTSRSWKLISNSSQKSLSILLLFYRLETLWTQCSKINWSIVLVGTINMFKMGRYTSTKFHWTFLASLMCPFQNSLSDSHSQMFIFALVDFIILIPPSEEWQYKSSC